MPSERSVELEAVILSTDSQLIQTLSTSLQRSDIEATTFTESSAAAEYISNRKVDALIVDSEVTGATELLETVKGTRSNAQIPVFVTIHKPELYAKVAAAAHFIIEKPVSPEAFERALRAARNRMLRERRRYYRQPVQVPITVARARGQMLVKGTSLNISENGMALRCELPFLRGELVDLLFNLPGIPNSFSCSGEVVWADTQGLGGVHFLPFNREAQKMLSIWIQKQFEGEAPVPPSRPQ